MYFYIVNPSSGGGKINKIQSKLLTLLRQNKIDGEFVKTTGKGDASRLVKIAIERGAKTIVAVGGDSTISEVINAMPEDDVVFGIIPIGKTNVLAKSLGINDWQSAIKVLAKRRVKTMEMGECNNKLFITSLDIGFEPLVKEDREDNKSFLKNIMFKKKFIAKVFSAKSFNLEIKFDKDFSIKSSVLNVSILNPGFSLNKEAQVVEKDKLTAFIVPFQPKISLLKSAAQMSSMQYSKVPFISQFRAKNIYIEAPDKPQPVYADSALIGNTPISVKLSMRKVKMILSKLV